MVGTLAGVVSVPWIRLAFPAEQLLFLHCFVYLQVAILCPLLVPN